MASHLVGWDRDLAMIVGGLRERSVSRVDGGDVCTGAVEDAELAVVGGDDHPIPDSVLPSLGALSNGDSDGSEPPTGQCQNQHRNVDALAQVDRSLPLVRAPHVLLRSQLMGVGVYMQIAESTSRSGFNEDAAHAAHRVATYTKVCEQARDAALDAARLIRKAQ